MRALFAVFSGTGNTRRVSDGLADELRALGHDAEIYPIRNEAPMPALDAFDVLILAYPVHAFNAPAAALAFMKKLPAAEGMPAYLLRTSGEPSKLNDASGITPKRILAKKGYDVLGELSYVMPYNIIFRHSDGMAARMWRDAELRFPEDAAAIAAGVGEKRRVNALRRMVAFVCRIEHTAMPVLGKTFRASKKKCVGCGACAGLCPRGNIKMVDGRPKFGTHCVGCMACSFGCPEDAIRISVLNLWRVNGKYSFEGEPATDEENCRYCRKMYLKYFHAIEDRAERSAPVPDEEEEKK